MGLWVDTGIALMLTTLGIVVWSLFGRRRTNNQRIQDHVVGAVVEKMRIEERTTVVLETDRGELVLDRVISRPSRKLDGATILSVDQVGKVIRIETTEGAITSDVSESGRA